LPPAIGVTGNLAIKATFSQLWFAVGTEVAVVRILLQNVDCRLDRSEAIFDLLQADKIEIVGRGVVFRIARIGRARYAPDGQIEAGRAVLPLIIS
jgi:hypothetical protein